MIYARIKMYSLSSVVIILMFRFLRCCPLINHPLPPSLPAHAKLRYVFFVLSRAPVQLIEIRIRGKIILLVLIVRTAIRLIIFASVRLLKFLSLCFCGSHVNFYGTIGQRKPSVVNVAVIFVTEKRESGINLRNRCSLTD